MTTTFTSNTGEVSQQGSLTRVDHYQAPQGPLQTAPTELTRVGNAVERITYRDGQITTEQMGVSRYQAGQVDPNNKSVVATMQRIGGATTVELVPGLAASRTHIAQAQKEGLVEPAGDGRWRDVTARGGRLPFDDAPPVAATDPEPTQQQETDQLAGPDEAYFNAEEDKAYAEDIAPLNQGLYDSAVALATVASLDGTDLSQVEERLARDGGMDRDTASQMVQAAYGMYRDTVVRAMEPEGISAAQAPAFFDYCRTRPRELQNAIGKLTAARDLSGFRQLATLYRGTQRGRE